MTWEIDGKLLDALVDLGVELERVEAGAYVVTLRSRRVTHLWLLGGEQDVRVEAFVMHVLEGADTARLHRHVLTRNRGLRGVHYGLDDVGDLFLFGSLSLADATAEGVDRLLGEVLALRDADDLAAVAYGSAVPDKALLDGAGRRAAGVPEWAPRRDTRR